MLDEMEEFSKGGGDGELFWEEIAKAARPKSILIKFSSSPFSLDSGVAEADHSLKIRDSVFLS